MSKINLPQKKVYRKGFLAQNKRLREKFTPASNVVKNKQQAPTCEKIEIEKTNNLTQGGMPVMAIIPQIKLFE
ncbi:hypothetical protein [Carboxydocella sp. ULO1]|uniref:hypothetical protein n=1 Tax=Carboxydocella sp. ULO1 TaxID=1926599 RepID=UPI0009AEC5BA|nr:hypothetical protein [Carboxydocella sp. ULO1]